MRQLRLGYKVSGMGTAQGFQYAEEIARRGLLGQGMEGEYADEICGSEGRGQSEAGESEILVGSLIGMKIEYYPEGHVGSAGYVTY